MTRFLKLMLTGLMLLLGPFGSSSGTEEAWQFKTGGMITGRAIFDEGSVYITGGTHLYSLDKAGQQQWRYDAGAGTFGSVAVTPDGIVLLADNGLHKLDKSGQPVWHFETDDGPFTLSGETMGWGKGIFADPWAWYRSSPVVVQGIVFFGTRNGTFAVDLESGEKVWHAKTGISHTRPAHHEDILVIGSWDNHLYGLKTSDGAVVWKVRSRLPEGAMAGWKGWEGFNLDPVIHNGIVYVGNRGTYFYTVKAETGVEQWSAKDPSSWIGSPALVSKDTVFYGLSDGYALIGRGLKMGKQELWFRNNFANFAKPQANDTHVFMASLSGDLYAIDRKSGEAKTVLTTPSSTKNRGEMIKEGGGYKPHFMVLEGYSHDTATRDVERMLQGLDSLLSLTLHDDMLYAGSAGGTLYAVPVPK